MFLKEKKINTCFVGRMWYKTVDEQRFFLKGQIKQARTKWICSAMPWVWCWKSCMYATSSVPVFLETVIPRNMQTLNSLQQDFAGKLVPSLSYNKIKWDIRRVEVKGHTAYGTLQLFTSENNYFKSFIPENEPFISFLWSICDDPDAFANCYVMD